MNNYLLQLLKEVKTIIIPGLGALTLTNEASGEMLFMPYLKYDDGNLAKHISEKEGMDINDAKNLIAKFVREVTAELDKGNSYDMYQFGSFKKIDGDVAFEQWNSGKSNEESAPVVTEEVAPIVEELVAVEIEEPIIEPAPVVALAVEPVIIEEPISELVVEPTIVPEPEIEQEKATEDQPEESNSVAETVVSTAILADVVADLPEEKIDEPMSSEPTPIVVESAVVEVAPEPAKPIETVAPVVEASTPIEEPVTVVPAAEKPVDLSKKPAAKQPEQPKKKRRVVGYILWGFLVLFMGGATYVAINFNTLKKDFPILADLAGENNDKALEKTDLAKGKEEVVVEEEVDDSEKNFDSVVEPIAEEEPTPEPQPEPEPVVVEQPKPVKTTTTVKKPRPKQSSGSSSVVIGKPDPSKPYHVVGGSFGSEANAKRFARELIGKGQPSVMVGEFNGMYRVSIASFSTKEEAVQAHSTLKDVVPQAWVFKWP